MRVGRFELATTPTLVFVICRSSTNSDKTSMIRRLLALRLTTRNQRFATVMLALARIVQSCSPGGAHLLIHNFFGSRVYVAPRTASESVLRPFFAGFVVLLNREIQFYTALIQLSGVDSPCDAALCQSLSRSLSHVVTVATRSI